MNIYFEFTNSEVLDILGAEAVKRLGHNPKDWKVHSSTFLYDTGTAIEGISTVTICMHQSLSNKLYGPSPAVSIAERLLNQ